MLNTEKLQNIKPLFERVKNSTYTVWYILFAIILLGSALRYRSFNNMGINNWSWDIPCFLSMAAHLDKGFYNYDKRVLIAYNAWEDFVNLPFHRDNKLLSKYGKKPIKDKYFVNDQGMAVIFWAAFKIFGDNAPLYAVWKLQFAADILSMLGIFLICRMMFGDIEGLIATFFYAINAFMLSFSRITVFPIQTTYYYYWMGPFAIVSVLFWGWVFRMERGSDVSAVKRILLFVGYGIFVGFFSLVRTPARLIIPFVGVFYLLCSKENMRGKVIALLLSLLMQLTFILPLISYNKKTLGTSSTVTRYVWHQIYVGLGFYKNKYNPSFDDVNGVRKADEKYGVKPFDWQFPTMPQLKTYEAAMKKEVMYILRESPELFVKNTLKNLYYGFFIAQKDESTRPTYKTRFDFNLNRLSSFGYSAGYALLLFAAMIYFFFKDKPRFYMTLLLLVIALYFLLTVCLVNPPYSFYIFGYYPIFYILLAVGISTFFRGLYSFSGLEQGLFSSF